ncbi:MAG: endoglucanase [Verrucomicrobiales bacterium]|nr:endoglucanase [Verrucomicrobiales bacterium]
MLLRCSIRPGNVKKLLLGAMLAFSPAVVPASRAALTVTVDPVAEGDDPASPNRAEFVVRLSEPADTETRVRYTTASDTAREGTDYEATRGELTIPAGQREGRVSVRLVADTEHEGPEHFSLIVWPDGEAPVPVFTEIPRPQPSSGPAFQWLHREGGVSEGNWFHQNVLGHYSSAGWGAEGFLPFANDAVAAVLKGPWLVWQSGTQGSAFLNFARRQSGGLEGWESQDRLVLNFSYSDSQRFSAIAGDLAAVYNDWEVTLVRLFRHQPPAIVGRVSVMLPALARKPPDYPVPEVSGLAFTGGLLAVAVGTRHNEEEKSEIRIYEPSDSAGSAWGVKAVIPDAAGPLLAEGDTVVARPLLDGAGDSVSIFTRNEGGTDHWGAGGVLRAPAPAVISGYTGMAMNGGMLLVPEWEVVGPYTGKIHTFLRSADGNAWSYAGGFSKPQPGEEGRLGQGLALGGRDLLTVAPPIGFGDDKGWGASFPGATVTVMDDDAPLASLELPAVFEPADGPVTVRGNLVLAQESTEPVTFTWQTSDGTARSGVDYMAASGEVTIPAGSLSAPLTVTILPDALTESTETLKVSVTRITGARLAESQAPWSILDTDRPAVVRADDIVCAEGGIPVNAAVRLYAAAEPLEVAVRAFTPVIVDHAGPVTDFGYAVPGVDWAGAPAVFNAAPGTSVVGLLPLTGTSDSTEDGSRRGLLRFELPEGAVGAGFSERLVEKAPTTPENYLIYESPTTDGKWAAALRYKSQALSVVIYRRGGAQDQPWTLWTTFAVPFIEGEVAGMSLKLRGERLVLYSKSAGTARIFHPGPEGAADRKWVLEAALDQVPGNSTGSWLPMDFDGESLVFGSSRTRLLFINRGGGDWSGRQSVDFANSPFSDVLLSMSAGRVALVPRAVGYPATVRFLERVGRGPSPWRLNAESRIELPAGVSDYRFWTSGNLLVIDKKIHVRKDNGEWVPQQTMPDIVVGMDRGVIIGSSAVYADVGPPEARWQAVGFSYNLIEESGFEFNAGVIVSRNDYSRSTLRIMEAGMGFTIEDRETFKLIPIGVDLPEPRYAATGALVWIETEEAAPVDIPITFETVAGGTATPDLDYRPVKGTVIIRAGARSGGFAIPILPDAIPEGNETIQVNLSAPEFGRLTVSNVTVTIGSFPIVPSTRPAAFVPEPASGEAVYQLPVHFAPASSTEVAATYRITPGTASAADALMTQEGAITIPPGMQTVLIPLTVYADSLTEGPETVRVTLQTLGPVPGTPLSFEVTIDDRASGGSEPDHFTVPQNSGIDFDSSRNVLANDTSGHTVVLPSRGPSHGTVTWRDDGTFCYLPTANFTGTDRFAYTSQRFVLPADTVWKWLNPQNGRDPGETVAGFQTNWMKPGFDASSWQDGKGLMAYGGIGQGAGAVATDTDIKTPSSGRYTAYFRTSLTFNEQPAEGVAVEFICDDGAVFYLNGEEIGRFAKAPIGAFATAPDTFTLLAPGAFADSEENQIRRLYFPSARFKAGENVFAVSLHNGSISSSDLGLKVTGLTPGNFSTPTWVTMEVADSGAPPVIRDDVYAPGAGPWNAPVLDSRLMRSSVYWNDGLLGDDGLPYDPILEVEIGGDAAGGVTFEKDTGHFRLAAPKNYYGTTGFTYRVRDKDGWSNTANVGITVHPSRSYDIWRAAVFGNGSFYSAGMPDMDEDEDGTADLLEYVLGGNPVVADSVDPLRLSWNGVAWVLSFNTAVEFDRDTTVHLESSDSLTDIVWTRLATISAYSDSLTRLAPGISYTKGAPIRDPQFLKFPHSFTVPPGPEPRRYFRLRASQEPNILNP